MARHPEGWRIRKRAGHRNYSVIFRLPDGRRIERSTGERDPRPAAAAAARIYAAETQRAPQRIASPRRGSAPPLDVLIATWLASDSTFAPRTARNWESYGRHWCAHWATLDDITEATAEEYRNARLQRVQGATVRKELGALRRFLRWCQVRGHLTRPVEIPGVPARVVGTAYEKRRRKAAPEVSPEQLEAFLAALPEWSASRKVAPFPIRARFVVQYETSLRPSTIDRLETPRHWAPGRDAIEITPDIDKARAARSIPITARAREALERVALRLPRDDHGRPCGLLFGRHDYREHVARAAAAAFPPAVADVWTGAHTRSARLTHWLDRPGASLSGAQYMAGHLDLRSTSRYQRPSFRAAAAMLERLEGFGGQVPDSGDDAEESGDNGGPEKAGENG